MHEVFPVAAGAVLGVAALRIADVRWRFLVLVLASIAVGAIASAVSGELRESWAFVLVDAAQVLLVALLTGAAVTGWQRRTHGTPSM